MGHHPPTHSAPTDDQVTTVGRTLVGDFVRDTNYEIVSEGGSLLREADETTGRGNLLLTDFLDSLDIFKAIHSSR